MQSKDLISYNLLSMETNGCQSLDNSPLNLNLQIHLQKQLLELERRIIQLEAKRTPELLFKVDSWIQYISDPTIIGGLTLTAQQRKDLVYMLKETFFK